MVRAIPIGQHASSAARRALGMGDSSPVKQQEFESAAKIGMPNVSGFLNR